MVISIFQVLLLVVSILIGCLAISVRKIKILIYYAVGVTMSLSIIIGLDGYRMSSTLFFIIIFLPIPMLISIIINIVAVFKFWNKYKFTTFIPLAISLLCVPALIISSSIGEHLSLYIFNKRIPQYEEAVRLMKDKFNGEPISLIDDEIPEQYRHFCYHIIAEGYEPNGLTVEFLWGESIPIYNTAYVYRSDGSQPPRGGSYDWERSVRINDHWFKVFN